MTDVEGGMFRPEKVILVIRGATDHKAHGSDRVTVFESRVGSFSDQQQQ